MGIEPKRARIIVEIVAQRDHPPRIGDPHRIRQPF
jgi:hypothetical protein